MSSKANSVKVRQRVQINMAQGKAEFVSFTGLHDNKEHVALIFNKADQATAPKVRIHSECFTGDIFQSARCDCGNQLNEAISKFGDESGIILYMRQEGRGIGLYNKLDAYKLQDSGIDTFEANHRLGFGHDERDYKAAGDMLKALSVTKIQLMTNNPKKIKGLEEQDIEVVKNFNTGTYLNPSNVNYLRAKIEKDGHTIAL